MYIIISKKKKKKSKRQDKILNKYINTLAFQQHPWLSFPFTNNSQIINMRNCIMNECKIGVNSTDKKKCEVSPFQLTLLNHNIHQLT